MFKLPTKTQAFQLSLAVGKRTVFVVHFHDNNTHRSLCCEHGGSAMATEKDSLGATYSVLPVKLCPPVRRHSACLDSKCLAI